MLLLLRLELHLQELLTGVRWQQLEQLELLGLRLQQQLRLELHLQEWLTGVRLLLELLDLRLQQLLRLELLLLLLL